MPSSVITQAASLSAAVGAFTSELDEIESIFASCKGNRTVVGFVFAYTPTEDGCLISMWDAWTRFLRSLVILSASGVTEGLDGNQYSPAVARSESDVLAALTANRKGHNFRILAGEPKWNDLLSLADICQFLGLQNETVIISALSSYSVTLGPISVSNPVEEIRTCRNFVAHKTDPMLTEVINFALSPFVDLSTHLRERRSGVEAFSEWKDCLVALAETAAR